MKLEAYFIIFKGPSFKQINTTLLEGESPILIIETIEKQLSQVV